MKPHFFPKPSDFRKWLRKNHTSERKLWVGYYKKGTGRPSITWPESVDEALCFGWIDGIRKSIDEESYKIRFTPRKPTSHWSAINIKRVGVLTKLGMMRPAGQAAFNKRTKEKSRRASYEQRSVALDPAYQKEFRSRKKAYAFFQSLPSSTRKPSIWWVMSAKKEETRRKRLNILIKSSDDGKVIPPLRWTRNRS